LIKFQGDTVPAKFHCWINEPGQKPFAVVQIAKRIAVPQDHKSRLFKAWAFPAESSQVDGSTFHAITEENYVRQCLIIEDDHEGSNVFEALPYTEWWSLF